jgi:hypothetical protein
MNRAAAAAEDRDSVATITRTMLATPEPVEVISPELALIDPELAQRARALLPRYGDVELFDEVPVVSPELVLVDPVLADSARARLPDRPLAELHLAPAEVAATEEAAELPSPEEVQPEVVAPAPQPELAWSPELLWQAAEERNLEEHALTVRKRQRTRRIVLGIARLASLAAAAAVIAAAGFLAGASMSRRGPPESAVFNRSAKTVVVLRPASSAVQTTTRQQARETRPGPRTFLWAPVAGAVHYEVAFYRSGRRVLVVRTKEARLLLPPNWTYRGRRARLVPGVYRWYVWPIYSSAGGQRLGKAVVQSRLTVSGR